MENALNEAVNAEETKPAPEPVETASKGEAPVSGDNTPEGADKPAKTFSQEEVDKLIGKRLAREERKWQRERDRAIAQTAREQQPAPKAQEPANKPVPDSYKSTEEYLEALTDWKAEQKITAKLSERDRAEREARARREAEEASAEYREREEAARDKYDDFEEVAYNPKLSISDVMADTIQASEQGAELAYYLGKNPKEAARIAALKPFLQAKELGRLEAKLADAPAAPAKKPSSAPEPIKPVAPKGGSQPVLDTTDPKSLEKMGTSAWIKADRERRLRQASGTR